MTGLFQENGPFLWIPGTFRPVRNPWSWHRLAHIVYVDQPIGTGYSAGPRDFVDEHDVARGFGRFWRQFVDKFHLHGARVYLTGESYAGMYIPYIGTHMLELVDADQGQSAYFDVRGALIYDPLFADKKVQTDVPMMRFVHRTRLLHPFDNKTMDSLDADDAACGFSAYLDKFLSYPPPEEPQPPVVPGTGTTRCEMLRYRVVAAARKINPCWDMYNIASTCPFKWSAMGPELYSEYEPEGADSYFGRDDVQRALNVVMPDEPWVQCVSSLFAQGPDRSPPSAVYALPNLIDRTRNVIIAHGSLDFVLIDEGTLLAIQNMTWGGGVRGFQAPPVEPLVIPRFNEAAMLAPVAGNASMLEPVDLSGAAGVGHFGVAHAERGLTYVGVELSGHMGPQSAPSVAMRLVEAMLGKVANLSSAQPFVLDPRAGEEGGDKTNGWW
jgi:carboxypeptidase D